MPPEAVAAARVFAGGEPVTVERVGGGLIHLSCRVSGRDGRSLCLLQRVNAHVFQRPELLMANLGRVTGHLAGGDAAEPGDAPDLLPWPGGARAWVDRSGAWWRAWRFLDGRVRVDRAGSAALAGETGRAFGRFQMRLASLGGPPLHTVLPHFHDTPWRFAQLEAVAGRDPAGRARDATPAISALLARRGRASRLAALQADGVLPGGIAHNDAKIDNLLFDPTGAAPPVVIDLDTVMPGLALHDFGDMARTVAATEPEDTDATARMDVDTERFAQLAHGYQSAAGFLVPAERRHLVTAAEVIALEQAARFLTDYLAGDTYYSISRPRHNLDRALAQTALAVAFQRREAALAASCS